MLSSLSKPCLAIDSLFLELIPIGIPLDLLKAGVAWLLKKMGFDESSEALKKFSFTKLISDMVSGFFGFVQTAIDWIKSVIADPKAALAALWLKIVGEGGLID